MVVDMVNQTGYANIYRVCEDDGKVVGTVELRLAGRDCGLYATSISAKYKNADIKKIWKQWWEE